MEQTAKGKIHRGWSIEWKNNVKKNNNAKNEAIK
jgi:hypothetical protein